MMVTRTWTSGPYALYDYSCDSFVPPYTVGYSMPAFTAGAAGNISSYNTTQPYPAYSSGTLYISEVRLGAGVWSIPSTFSISILVGGSTQFSGSLSAPAMSTTGYTQCNSGTNMSVLTLSSPVAVTSGQSVQIQVSSISNTGGSAAVHVGTVGFSPGNNSATQYRYRVIGMIPACNS
jgi:hypothetical protein